MGRYKGIGTTAAGWRAINGETLAKSRPVVALCQWQDFNYDRRLPHVDPSSPLWLTRPELPTACRASLGARILTVWLPQGAVIRCRLSRVGGDPMADDYSHVFGSHDRMSRTRIRITLTEYPTNA
jgi:hypothetical protein